LTRSTATTLFGYVLVLIWLTPLMDSPGHPEEICLLLLVAVLLLACSIERAWNAAVLAGIGAAVASLALVKINIGAYVGGGVVLALLRSTVPTAWTRIAIPLLTAALLLLPFAVLALLFDFWWVRLYSLYSVLAIGAALLAFQDIRPPTILRTRDWWIIVGGGGVTCLIVIGGMMLAGSSARAILDAVLLQNANFIRNWYIPLQVGPRDLLVATASALAAVAYRASASQPHLQRYRDQGVLALKWGFVLVGGVLFVAPGELFLILVPFCWLLMVQPAGIPRPHAIERGVAGLVGAIMSLYPFPVAGHQIVIGALLPIVMVPVLAHDVLTALHRQKADRGVGRRWPASSYGASLAVAAVLAIGAGATLLRARAYWRAVPLGLPGTSLIRIDPKQADDMRWVTAQLSSCASSYSVPGLWSFAFWTGQSLPTALNINDELAFIGHAKQQVIVQALSRQPDLCVVYNRGYLRFFDRGQIRTDPPLLHYVRSDFVPTAQRDGYVILKRRASEISRETH
jgi:hypothetical protein